MFSRFGPVFGQRVRSLRESAGITQDQLARAVSRTGTGVRWTRARLGQVESGRATPDLATMVAIALALDDLTGRAYRLTDLLPDADDPGLALLRAAVAGQVVRHRSPDPDDPRDDPGWGQVEDRAASAWGGAADRLVLDTARALYGHTATEERDARAGADATPQLRGWVTRALLAELTEAVREARRSANP